MKFTDMLGVEVSVGSIIVYGKSNRNNPINIGKVISFEGDFIRVLGKGCSKTGNINGKWSRFVIVPDSYWGEE